MLRVRDRVNALTHLVECPVGLGEAIDHEGHGGGERRPEGVANTAAKHLFLRGVYTI